MSKIEEHKHLVFVATAILNNQFSERLKRLTKDTLNRAGLDWDEKNNRVIVK
jgi:hypothetical protein